MNSKLRRSHTEEWSNKWPVGLAARCQVMFCLYDYPETIHRSDKPWRIYIRHTNCTAPILASTTTTNDYDLSSFPSVCGGRGGGCVRVCVCVCKAGGRKTMYKKCWRVQGLRKVGQGEGRAYKQSGTGERKTESVKLYTPNQHNAEKERD